MSKDLNILQINLNRSPIATEAALELALELKIGLVLIQEPFIITTSTSNNNNPSYRSINHTAFTQILPLSSNLRPRTLAYIAKTPEISSRISLSTSSPLDPDILVIDLSLQQTTTRIYNIYNEMDQAQSGQRTLERCLYNLNTAPNSLVIGDFNTHHPLWDPLNSISPRAQHFINWLEGNNLELINTPGTGTFYRPNLERPSILDLTFATSYIASKIDNWEVLPSIGSDHFPILFTLKSVNIAPAINKPDFFNIKQANWDGFKTKLQELVLSPNNIINSHEFNSISSLTLNSCLLLDQAATQLTSYIQEAAKANIPILDLGPKSKPWWNPEIKGLQTTFKYSQQQLNLTQPNTISNYLIARNKYFTAIKSAKKDHWNQFLEGNNPTNIYKAMAYTKGDSRGNIPPIVDLLGNLQTSFQDKAKALREALFPEPPTATPADLNSVNPKWQWPPLAYTELEKACSLKIKSKTPGPDNISQGIIYQTYIAIKDSLFKLYSKLLELGYHPKPWKQAIGVILKKPGKPPENYSYPKGYRVISLLNCLGKVSERILAQRLLYLAETTDLLHPSQMGGRKKKSVTDATLILTSEIEANKRLHRKTTALFLDVKGAFDHVAKNQLLNILGNLQLPLNLKAWVSSFLEDRSLKLKFDSQEEDFSPINTGIPQGSPISPILFLIYIRDLFPRISSAIKVLSYLDDIALITSSTSLQKNIRILERESLNLYQQGDLNGIKFDLQKTELIHFNTPKSQALPIQLPNKELVYPKQLVRWLGIWFDSKLSFKEHINIRISQAKSAFLRLARLANTERGLSPTAIRQLYLACITSLSDFSSPTWWKGQGFAIKALQNLQNMATRKILGAFKTSPTKPLEVEACLAPPLVRLNTTTRNYALRTLKLGPNHPTNKELEQISNESLNNPRLKPTQLENIKGSLLKLDPLDNIEEIQPFYHPPWTGNPLTITISNKDKEAATKDHLQLLETLQILDPETILAYSDASFMPDKDGLGVGLAIYKNQELIYSRSWNLGPKQLVYNGELEGLVKATEALSTIAYSGASIKVFSDNKAGLFRLRNLNDNPGQLALLQVLNYSNIIRDKGASIELIWVPGHRNIKGNELADKLAKEGLKLRYSNSTTTSLAYIGQQIRTTKRLDWSHSLYTSKGSAYSKTFGWRIRPTILANSRRTISSAFFQLKLGHGHFNSYLHKLGHSPYNTCLCGPKQTPMHLLLDCKISNIRTARDKVKKELNTKNLTLPLLLGTKSGIKATIKFLEETRLATRGWRQSQDNSRHLGLEED